jgi:gluconate kinase
MESVDWIHQDQDREKWMSPVNAVMSSWVQQNTGKFLTGSEAIIISRTLLTGLGNKEVKLCMQSNT